MLVMPFGRHKGTRLSALPSTYLKWCLGNLDELEPRLSAAIREEVDRRGVRFVPADPVLFDLEENLTARVADDPAIAHEDAGRLADHLLEAFEDTRRKFGIGGETEFIIDPKRPAWEMRAGRSQ